MLNLGRSKKSHPIKSVHKKGFYLKLPRLALRARLLTSFFVPIAAIIFLGIFSYSLSKNEITRVTTNTSEQMIKSEIGFFDLLNGTVRSHAVQLITNMISGQPLSLTLKGREMKLKYGKPLITLCLQFQRQQVYTCLFHLEPTM